VLFPTAKMKIIRTLRYPWRNLQKHRQFTAPLPVEKKFTAFLEAFSKLVFSSVAYMGVHDVERKTTARAERVFVNCIC
jgi:hypothetical protein